MRGRRWLGREALFSGNSSPCPSVSLVLGVLALGARTALLPAALPPCLPLFWWRCIIRLPRGNPGPTDLNFFFFLLAPESGRGGDRVPLSLLLFIYFTAQARLSFLVFPRDAALGADTKFRSLPTPVL